MSSCHSSRLPYIDVLKGILILLVIEHHIDNIARKVGLNNLMFSTLGGGYVGAVRLFFHAGVLPAERLHLAFRQTV